VALQRLREGKLVIMSGICSAHATSDPKAHPECAACQATMYDIFPDWDEAVKRAEAAGKFQCVCGFVYYLTTNMCPLCCRVLKGQKYDRNAPPTFSAWQRFMQEMRQIFHW
jgi:hypothetical protein